MGEYEIPVKKIYKAEESLSQSRLLRKDLFIAAAYYDSLTV